MKEAENDELNLRGEKKDLGTWRRASFLGVQVKSARAGDVLYRWEGDQGI